MPIHPPSTGRQGGSDFGIPFNRKPKLLEKQGTVGLSSMPPDQPEQILIQVDPIGFDAAHQHREVMKNRVPITWKCGRGEVLCAVLERRKHGDSLRLADGQNLSHQGRDLLVVNGFLVRKRHELGLGQEEERIRQPF